MKPCNLLKIIYEDDQVLVYHKPAGLATQSAKVGQPDAVSELRKYLAGKGAGAGTGSNGVQGAGAQGVQGRGTSNGNRAVTEPYLGIVHRLDQPVEGLLVFAKTKAAAANLTKQLEAGSLNKQYYATVCGKPVAETGELVDYLLKEGNQARVVSQGTPGAKKAVLQYKVTQSTVAGKQTASSGSTLTQAAAEADDVNYISRLDIHIDTGRFHQIRAQLAHAGWPILGDSKYGTSLSQDVSRQQGIRNVALLAYKLEFVHPKTGKKCEYNISEK